MAQNEPLQNIEYPELGDPNHVPKYIESAIKDLVQRSNMRYTTTTARDDAITSPIDGMESFTGTGASEVKWIRHNGAWVRQQTVKPKWVVFSPEQGYAGTFRYKLFEALGLVEVRWTCSTTIAAGASVFPLAKVPTAIRPSSDAVASFYGNQGYPLTGSISAAGNINVRNVHSAALTSHSGSVIYSLGDE